MPIAISGMISQLVMTTIGMAQQIRIDIFLIVDHLFFLVKNLESFLKVVSQEANIIFKPLYWDGMRYIYTLSTVIFVY